jgi:hypothetical protein
LGFLALSAIHANGNAASKTLGFSASSLPARLGKILEYARLQSRDTVLVECQTQLRLLSEAMLGGYRAKIGTCFVLVGKY